MNNIKKINRKSFAKYLEKRLTKEEIKKIDLEVKLELKVLKFLKNRNNG